MIFLSASIPDPERDKKYINTADIIAIRDAVRALATVVIPNSYLVWGGHPAITPLIRYVMNAMGANVQDHITLYQSQYYAKNFPKENESFEKVVVVPENVDRKSSLYDMRMEMFTKHKFKAGIFIGGMDGVEEEYKLFKELHRGALILPVASTGAAARIIYDKIIDDEIYPKPDERLLKDYAYMSMFKSLLKDYLIK